MSRDTLSVVEADPQGEAALSLLREAAIEARAAACGALRPLGDGCVEVRRMFVTRSARGCGLASTVLRALEAAAAQMGYRTMRLETGYRQLPAIALYSKHDFQRIEPFGEYANDPTSVCFEKSLSP